jgi:hypothetical protein
VFQVRIAAVVFGVALIVLILVEGFETVVQPRRVMRRYRVSGVFYTLFWAGWRWAAGAFFSKSRRRAGFLSAFGPLSLLGVFAIWVAALVAGFALVQWGARDALFVNAGQGPVSLTTYLYLSGTTFFTLGYGDVTPAMPLGRVLAVGEAGLGFGFLAAILSYLPALFQAYSRREVDISLLDARAGSPPSAGQLIVRAAREGNVAVLGSLLGELERWAAELLESQLSFPVLAYYRSQHDNQSWLGVLTAALDTCAVMMTQMRGVQTYQAQLTFAIARHAAVDMTLALGAQAPGTDPVADRLGPEQFAAMRSALAAAGAALGEPAGSEEALRRLRGSYEPFLLGLGQHLLLAVPPLMGPEGVADNWQRSAWMKPMPGIGALPVATADEAHFD